MAATFRPYIIDANLFVEAARGYYSFEFETPFWDKLVTYANDGKILSIDKVFDELNEGDDQLKKWASSDFRPYFANSQSGQIALVYSDLVNWVNKQTIYLPLAKNTFMDEKVADAWIIAYAKANDCILVTQEKSNPASQRRVVSTPFFRQ